MDQGIEPRGLRGLKGIGMNDWWRFGEINSNRMNLFMSIESVGRGVGFDWFFEGCCRDKSLWNEIGKRRIRDDLLRDIVVRDSTLANELIDLVHPNEFNHKGACKKHLHWTVLIVWCGLSSFGSLLIVSDTLLRILGFVYHRFVRVENRSMMAMCMIGFVSPNCFSFLCFHPRTFYWCIEWKRRVKTYNCFPLLFFTEVSFGIFLFGVWGIGFGSLSLFMDGRIHERNQRNDFHQNHSYFLKNALKIWINLE